MRTELNTGPWPAPGSVELRTASWASFRFDSLLPKGQLGVRLFFTQLEEGREAFWHLSLACLLRS